jgi:putative ABC transport system permease protein
MLAAVGGTQKHVRLVLLANGAIVGAIAASIGTALGVARLGRVRPDARVGGRPPHRSAQPAVVADRDDRSWPRSSGRRRPPGGRGERFARLPVVLALSGAAAEAEARAPLRAGGCGVDRDRASAASHCPTGRQRCSIVVGIVATILGALLLGPLAIRVFSGLAARVPIAPRLALRDLARYQARSGAALAAVTLALASRRTVVVIASAEAAKVANEPASLSDRQVRVYLGPPEDRKLIPTRRTAPRLARLTPGARAIAAQLDRATLLPLRKAVEPAWNPAVIGDTRFLPTIELTKVFHLRRRTKKRFRNESELYVATTPVLRYLGIDPATVNPGTDYLVDRSVATDDLVVPSMKGRRVYDVANVQKIETGRHLFVGSGGRSPVLRHA